MSNNSELIDKLSEGCTKKHLKGQTLWVLRDDFIECYEMFLDKKNKEWKYTKYLESDNIQNISCPTSYLDASKPIDFKWRAKILDDHKKGQNKKTQVVNAFRNKAANQKLTVYLKPIKHDLVLDCKHKDTCNKKCYRLSANRIVVTSTENFVIRGFSPDNHHFYKVPPRLIDHFELTEIEEDQ